MQQFKIVFNKMERKVDQLANAIKKEIEHGRFPVGEPLPSINLFSRTQQVARDTVEKAYMILKRQGLVVSVPGKGYFILK